MLASEAELSPIIFSALSRLVDLGRLIDLSRFIHCLNIFLIAILFLLVILNHLCPDLSRLGLVHLLVLGTDIVPLQRGVSLGQYPIQLFQGFILTHLVRLMTYFSVEVITSLGSLPLGKPLILRLFGHLLGQSNLPLVPL